MSDRPQQPGAAGAAAGVVPTSVYGTATATATAIPAPPPHHHPHTFSYERPQLGIAVGVPQYHTEPYQSGAVVVGTVVGPPGGGGGGGGAAASPSAINNSNGGPGGAGGGEGTALFMPVVSIGAIGSEQQYSFAGALGFFFSLPGFIIALVFCNTGMGTAGAFTGFGASTFLGAIVLMSVLPDEGEASNTRRLSFLSIAITGVMLFHAGHRRYRRLRLLLALRSL